jgi:hypothetical protein
MAAETQYDVFLSHNNVDREAMEEDFPIALAGR